MTICTLSAIGCINDDVRENEAFYAYSRHFRAKGMAVPEIYAISDDRRAYIQQDLGDQTLYGLLLDKKRNGGGFDSEMLELYRHALADLADIQHAGRDLDFSIAYPRADFDRQAILWDLNYFKYCFLKVAHIPFDEQRLEDDFNALADFLLSTDCNYFMYRDFNPRNIMVAVSGQQLAISATQVGGSPLTTNHYPLPTLYYIDYQGGRRGAPHYDVASLLYSAKSDLPESIRQELLRHYIEVSGFGASFMEHFWGYVLIRILQALGAYGYRGYCERKPYFLESIPLALHNLRNLIESHPLPVNLPEINRIAETITTHYPLPTTHYPLPTTHYPLTITVSSFSYKKGLPDDPSGNGGGFIFDCRALPNPGRYEQFKNYTGRDASVIAFLDAEPAVAKFLSAAETLIGQSVEKYLERNFTHLNVAFGCTGGQHRSVYCAEHLAQWLSATYPVNIDLVHREQETTLP